MSESEPVYAQSAVVPFRRVEGALEVLLITSRSRKRWLVPKGLLEPDMTPAESAAKEALEEAGVRGRTNEASIGEFSYKKWGGRCVVEVFPMEVTEELDDWDEKDERERRWVTLDEAVELVDRKGLRRILRGLRGQLR